MLLFATQEGVFRANSLPVNHVDRVFDAGAVHQLVKHPSSGKVFAATGAGLYSSPNGGNDWYKSEIPLDMVYSILIVNNLMFVGGRPSSIFYSDDTGITWSEIEEFKKSPIIKSFPTNPNQTQSQVRTLATPPSRSDTLLAGVEVGGLVGSMDGGKSWRKFSMIPDDVHHILCISPTEWVVCCGTGGPNKNGGVYRTNDEGKNWLRYNTGNKIYARQSHFSKQLYVGVNRTSPPWIPADANLFVGRKKLDTISYPGEPESFIVSWEIYNGSLLAGTNTGNILQNEGVNWELVGRIPIPTEDQRAYGVVSICSVLIS